MEPICPNCKRIVDFQSSVEIHCWYCGWIGKPIFSFDELKENTSKK